MTNYEIFFLAGGSLLLLAVSIWCIFLHKKIKKLQEEQREEQVRMEQLRKKEAVQYAMLPRQLLQIFGQDNYEKIKIGEQRTIQAVVMSFHVHGFVNIVRSRNTEEIFEFVNRILGYVVPAVLLQGGEIDKFSRAGLTAFYLQEPEKALRAAISACELVNQGEGTDTPYSMGLCYGGVLAGIVGQESRMGILTISDTTGKAEFLQKLGERYGARILISGNLKEQIPGFEKRYNSRYLGNIYLKVSGAIEELYEVYDGDYHVDKNAKRKTKLLFEKGVALFQERKFYDAQLHFIEVLKVNRMDGAAKEYLYLCNQYQERADIVNIPVYLEIY